MEQRDSRLEKIQAASGRHPIVQLALHALDSDEDTLRPAATLGARLAERLSTIEVGDELLSAVLGLVNLAFVLSESHDSFEASEVILSAVSAEQARIDQALEGLPGGSALGQALTAAVHDEFGAGDQVDPGAPAQVEHVSNAGFDLTATKRRR